MSLEETFEEIVRRVLREELQAIGSADRLLTAPQVAEVLGYTDVDSVRRLQREGKLEAVKLGENTIRFRNSDVQKLIRKSAA